MKRLLLKILTFGLIIAIGSAVRAQTYNWDPRVTWPAGHPASFVYAYFYYDDGKRSRIQQMTSAGSSVMAWGVSGAHYVGSDKPIPDSISLAWMSFSENIFYEGDFDLPVDNIRQIFRNRDPDANGYDRRRRRSIFIGVAPGGVVTVWVETPARTIEVAHFIAKTADFTMAELAPGAIPDRDSYVQGNMESQRARIAELDDFYSRPIDYPDANPWSDIYRREYDWTPGFRFDDGAILKTIRIEYQNGEMIYLAGDDPFLTRASRQPVPRKITARLDINGRDVEMTVRYDEALIIPDFADFFAKPRPDPTTFGMIANYTENEFVSLFQSGEDRAWVRGYTVSRRVISR